MRQVIGSMGRGIQSLTVHLNQLVSESTISGDKPLSAHTSLTRSKQKPPGILGNAEINANQ